MTNSKSPRRLLATRVPEDVWQILRVAMILEKTETVQALLLPVIEEFAAKLLKEPEVQAMLRAAKEYEARKAGELRRLDARAGARRRSNRSKRRDH